MKQYDIKSSIAFHSEVQWSGPCSPDSLQWPGHRCQPTHCIGNVCTGENRSNQGNIYHIDEQLLLLDTSIDQLSGHKAQR